MAGPPLLPPPISTVLTRNCDWLGQLSTWWAPTERGPVSVLGRPHPPGPRTSQQAPQHRPAAQRSTSSCPSGRAVAPGARGAPPAVRVTAVGLTALSEPFWRALAQRVWRVGGGRPGPILLLRRGPRAPSETAHRACLRVAVCGHCPATFNITGFILGNGTCLFVNLLRL